MSRPDTALRRSDELLAVNQPGAALSAVSEIFSSKRFKSTPLSTLEPIMVRFLELCVTLRKGRTAKEGLHLYKNVAQNTSVSAVETVVKFFLDKSKERLDEALAKVDEVAGPAPVDGDGKAPASTTTTTKEDGSLATVEVEDLEAAETPESILLSTVSDEKSRDRTYRTLVTPWLRFLWEAYRTALDILRNNARLEVLYQTVALDAFSFCLKHTRKTEFRRLAEMLRQHFANAQKYSTQTYAINISDPETLQRHLDIRFAQLNTAVELELWQEAFRSAEDIHGLVAASRRTPRASMMASFYEKLVKVFAVGQNFLFHAAAYNKLWSLQASSQGPDNDKFAGLVLLSALSVPIAHTGEKGTRRDPVTGEERDTFRGRMTLMGLLDLPAPPNRETLLRDALKRGVLKSVSPELRELYKIIETDFHPLRITSKLEPIFASLRASPDTVRYVEPLKNVVLSRLFQQLGQVYDSVQISRVVKLATFKDELSEDKKIAQTRVERFITDACRRGEMTVRLDHNDGIVEFEEKLFQSSGSAEEQAASANSVDTLQPTPATLLQMHLTKLAQTLYVSLDTIAPDTSVLAIAKKQAEQALQNMADNLAKDREAVLARRFISDQRKQRAEAEAREREKEAEAARALARQEHAAKEAKRVEQEARARQLEIIRKNNEAVKAEEARKLADKLKSAGALKAVPEDIETLDTAALMRIQVEQLEKDRKDMAEKLRIIGKRIDHTERAFRKEEVPLLHLDYEMQQKRDRHVLESSRKARIAELKAAHASDLRIKHRLDTIMPDYENFKNKKLSAVQDEYERKVAKARKKIEEEKAKRKADVEKRRAEAVERKRREEEERRQAEEEARRQQEEEERRAEEEERARQAEEARLAEEKRRKEEEAAKRRAELLEQHSKLDEQARKQREREEEVERRRLEREREKKEQATRVPGSAGWRREAPVAATQANDTAAAPSGERPRLNLAPRSSAAGGSWREREANRGTAPSPSEIPARTASPTTAAAPASGERPRIALAPRSGTEGGSWRERQAAKGEPAAGQGDGFQTVEKTTTSGAYRPPGARGGESSNSRWRRD